MRHFSNKTSKRIMIVSITVILLGVLLSALYFIPKYRLLNEYTENPGLVEESINQALDDHAITLLISEFRIRNDGAYPSPQYLTETMSPQYPLFYEEIKIKGEDENPSASAWPKIRELHVWPGYACVSAERYMASEIDYGQLLRKNSEKFASVSVRIIETAKQRQRTDDAYSCL